MSMGDEMVPREPEKPPAVAPPATSTTQQRPMAQERLASERVIINAPMSFAGATQRAWRIGQKRGGARIALVPLVVIPLLIVWWLAIALWYLTFGIFLIPYRLLRRGARKRKAEAMRHRETLAAMDAMRQDRDK
jgi:hypothetical protein